jgi:hypothetical protein
VAVEPTGVDGDLHREGAPRFVQRQRLQDPRPTTTQPRSRTDGGCTHS